MPRLRKMLGDVNFPGCIALMRQIETQSARTLAAWAVRDAASRCLPLYEAAFPGDDRLRSAVSACEACLHGDIKLAQIKPLLREAAQVARELEGHSVAQAAARAVSTACATIATPTNALGFVFYSAAACAYSELGLCARQTEYDAYAEREFDRALHSLNRVSVPEETSPARITWNC